MCFKKIFFTNILLIIVLCGCSINNKKNSNFYSLSKKNDLPIIKWKIPVGIGNGKYYSKLSIAYDDGIVYAADRKGIIKAIIVNTGKELWSVNLLSTKHDNLNFYISSELLSGGITVDNNTIYIGKEIGTVIALNKYNGKILWESDVLGEAISKPVVIKDLLLIHTNNGIFQALNIFTGKNKWSINLDHENIFSIRGKSSPAIYYDTAIIGGSNGRISAIKFKTGEVIWHKYISKIIENNEIDRLHDVNVTPVIDYTTNNMYAIAYNGNLAAINLISRKIIWEINVGSINDIFVNVDNIYLIDQNDYIIKINKSDGSIIWKNDSMIHRGLTPPVVCNGYLITADKIGYLYWFNLKNGELVFKYQLNKIGFSNKPIVINNNKILIQGIDGMIYYILINETLLQ